MIFTVFTDFIVFGVKQRNSGDRQYPIFRRIRGVQNEKTHISTYPFLLRRNYTVYNRPYRLLTASFSVWTTLGIAYFMLVRQHENSESTYLQPFSIGQNTYFLYLNFNTTNLLQSTRKLHVIYFE